jgi:hypothetical protein
VVLAPLSTFCFLTYFAALSRPCRWRFITIIERVNQQRYVATAIRYSFAQNMHYIYVLTEEDDVVYYLGV